MKKTVAIYVIILFVMTGCERGKKQHAEDFITIDVMAKYPYKTLILQDFMDVEYIPLETTDEFVCQGHVQAVGKDIIIVKNQSQDGNIFIFHRNGKILRKINRKGQGGEEYTNVSSVTLDEVNGELFVNDLFTRKIFVYDLEGNFKRCFHHKEDLLFVQIYNFDNDNLICHDAIYDNSSLASYEGQSFMLVSKQDGSITKEIQIPFKEKKSIVIRSKDEASGLTHYYLPSSLHPILPYFTDFILSELSADTLYRYSPDRTMRPFIVRTPSIQSMEPEEFLLLSLLTDRYYFMESVSKKSGYPTTDLVYDKQENALFKYKVHNGDYTNAEEAFLKSPPINGEVPSRQYLEAYKLVQAYQGGRLKGRLKEIAATLDEESNPVIMLIKHKK